jgi:hypothetical protein
VKLTWDETPHERVAFMARNFSKDELADQDLAAYIASDTDSDEGMELRQFYDEFCQVKLSAFTVVPFIEV